MGDLLVSRTRGVEIWQADRHTNVGVIRDFRRAASPGKRGGATYHELLGVSHRAYSRQTAAARAEFLNSWRNRRRHLLKDGKGLSHARWSSRLYFGRACIFGGAFSKIRERYAPVERLRGAGGY